VLKLLIPARPTRSRVLIALKEYASVMTQCPLPTLTMVVRRYAALHPAEGVCLAPIQDMEHFIAAIIERACLDDGCTGLGLTPDPPDGASVRYAWGKDRRTLADPRTQALTHLRESQGIEIGSILWKAPRGKCCIFVYRFPRC
jgi:hypothetical protein